MSRETEKVLNPEIMKQTQSLVTFEKTDDILQDMRGIIDSSRDAAYRAVNVTLIRRNWLIGYRISEEELSGENRAEYGASVIARLSKELSKEYGKGFTKTNLYSFYSFYKTADFPDAVWKISAESDVVALCSAAAGSGQHCA